MANSGGNLRERHQRAEEADPTLGGFTFLEARGPDGLVADAAARQLYFGESSRAGSASPQ